MDEWYKESWNIALNDILNCETKIRKRILNTNYLKDIWNLFLVHVFEKVQSYTPGGESLYFWRQMGQLQNTK